MARSRNLFLIEAKVAQTQIEADKLRGLAREGLEYGLSPTDYRSIAEELGKIDRRIGVCLTEIGKLMQGYVPETEIARNQK